jgi:3-isopropylmalate/(R)-2-methylmalate dehydratase large subunit
MGIVFKSIPMQVKFRVLKRKKSLAYMGFEEDDVMIGKPIDFVFQLH